MSLRKNVVALRVISVFSKPKLHKILPPLVWDKPPTSSVPVGVLQKFVPPAASLLGFDQSGDTVPTSKSWTELHLQVVRTQHTQEQSVSLQYVAESAKTGKWRS
ncbi:hypothetical protein fugu_019639 [Takifugu bimaculatus]|uniref:Uncharacterized protein n=1 Tax=Takifugu bimaculatus TaxID=433685 RepID=A0A4Z2BGX7_9TELE|nr:hypothetical protein fugu_019639 [Takifugu bimaculatus]